MNVKLNAVTMQLGLLCFFLIYSNGASATNDARNYAVTTGPWQANTFVNEKSYGTFLELHAVNNPSTSNVTPPFKCTNNGAVIPGSVQSYNATILHYGSAGPSTNNYNWTYQCMVNYDVYEQAHSSIFSALQSWYSQSTSTGSTNFTDKATIQYTYGITPTQVWTDDVMWYSTATGGWPSNNYGGKWVSLTVNGQSATGPSISESGGNYPIAGPAYNGVHFTVTNLMPYGVYSVSKTIYRDESGGFTSTCTGNFVMDPSWVGESIYITCCATNLQGGGTHSSTGVIGATGSTDWTGYNSYPPALWWWPCPLSV